MINAACEAVSGSYTDLFNLPALYEDDPDPSRQVDGSLDWSGTTIRAYSTGIVLTSKPMRRNLSTAVQPWLTSANWREVDSRGDRFPDAYALFLSEYQLREAFSFVQATGLLRSYGGLASQTLGGTGKAGAVLLSQWEDLLEVRNTRLDGTGQRIQVDFGGTYDVELQLSWDNPDAIETSFQLTVDAAFVGPTVTQNDDYMSGSIGDIAMPAPTSKIGIAVWTNAGQYDFKLRSGWLGIKRTS